MLLTIHIYGTLANFCPILSKKISDLIVDLPPPPLHPALPNFPNPKPKQIIQNVRDGLSDSKCLEEQHFRLELV